uniref:Uncharacterized protein n=1 Tax=Octopus bimaculoides TaxID=37653 RepID=A0A0L8I9R3_OCTBM
MYLSDTMSLPHLYSCFQTFVKVQPTIATKLNICQSNKSSLFMMPTVLSDWAFLH